MKQNGDIVITKRLLGLMITAVGGLGLIGLLAVDFLRAGQYDGIGPTQRIGLMVATAVLLFGLSLIPLGDKPA